MKTLEEIYNEVLASEELTARYKSLQSAEEQAAFVKKLGGEATAEEIADFLDKQNSKFGELTDAELEQVVGGKGGSAGKTCPYCGSDNSDVARSDDGCGIPGEYYCYSCRQTFFA